MSFLGPMFKFLNTAWKTIFTTTGEKRGKDRYKAEKKWKTFKKKKRHRK